MANIKLMRGPNVTTTNPALIDGQLLFDTVNHSIWMDIDTSTRVKLYDNIDSAIVDITNLKNTLAGISGTVVQYIADTISDLKDEIVLSVTAGPGITVSGTATNPQIAAKLSSKEGNALTIETEEGKEGLYYSPTAAPEYTIEKSDTAEDGYAATYKLMKSGTQSGVSINIPKDKFIKSVELVNEDGEGTAGKFIKMTFQNDDSTVLYLDVETLVNKVYTSGSAASDMVVVAVDEDTNKITASVTDGTVTKAKLAIAVQTSLGLADTAVQPSALAVAEENNKYISGITVSGNTITFKKKTIDLSALQWGEFS